MPTYITTVRIEVPDDNVAAWKAKHQANGYFDAYVAALDAADFDFEIVCTEDATPVKAKVGRPRKVNGAQEAAGAAADGPMG